MLIWSESAGPARALRPCLRGAWARGGGGGSVRRASAGGARRAGAGTGGRAEFSPAAAAVGVRRAGAIGPGANAAAQPRGRSAAARGAAAAAAARGGARGRAALARPRRRRPLGAPRRVPAAVCHAWGPLPRRGARLAVLPGRGAGLSATHGAFCRWAGRSLGRWMANTFTERRDGRCGQHARRGAASAPTPARQGGAWAAGARGAARRRSCTPGRGTPAAPRPTRGTPAAWPLGPLHGCKPRCLVRPHGTPKPGRKHGLLTLQARAACTLHTEAPRGRARARPCARAAPQHGGRMAPRGRRMAPHGAAWRPDWPGRSHAPAVGHVAPRRLARTHNAHDLAALQPVVARDGVRQLPAEARGARAGGGVSGGGARGWECCAPCRAPAAGRAPHLGAPSPARPRQAAG
jgi:hypothetical protein